MMVGRVFHPASFLEIRFFLFKAKLLFFFGMFLLRGMAMVEDCSVSVWKDMDIQKGGYLERQVSIFLATYPSNQQLLP